MLIENILPPASEEDETCVYNKIKAPITLKLEPVGRWYQAYALRQLHKHSLSHASLSSSGSDDSSDCLDSDGEDEEDLNIYDPKNWKDQDHYSILGLTKLRHLASFNQIKKAYKRKVLVHHPDKRRARGLEPKEGEEDFFTCVTRAWETLGSSTKRRSYDSIDPNFDNSIPSINSESKKNFYKVFTPVFLRNSRFSTAYGTATKVPDLGDDETIFDEVNKFYNFWYEFETWREFSYLDEEEKDKGENREERRWIEKQNKATRQKKKREESSRLRSLVDNSYACDPRIARHREEEKTAKAAAKQAKRDLLKAKQEEQERIEREAEEEIKRKEQELIDASKLQADKLKREKDAIKKQMKKQRKSLRSAAKEFDYFSDCRDEQLNYMQDVERLAETLSLVSLQELNAELTTDDKEAARVAFVKSMSTLLSGEENERRALLEKAAKAAREKNESCSTLRKTTVWLPAEVDSLIKAVNLFPAGTTNRWETIAVFIEQHVTGSQRSAKEVLFKAKDLQKNDATLKETANKEAFDKFESQQTSKPAPATVEESDISARYDSIAVQQIAETGTNPALWTSEEQKILEQALKTYPSSLGKDRWVSIAGVLPNRSKRDCMNRYKELVEKIREKKAAQAAAAIKIKKMAT